MKLIYLQIAEALESRRAALQVPLALPDERGLAEEYGVSRETIRRALQVLESNGAVTRKRRVGTFLQPLQMRSGRLEGKSIGVVPPWWAEPGSWYASMIFEGVSRWANANDCKFTVLHAGPYPMHEHDWMERARKLDLSGILWVHPQEKQLHLLQKVARLLPTVILGRTLLGEGLHHVIPNYDQAASLIDTHLHERGCAPYAVIEKNVFDPFTKTWLESIAHAQEKRGVEFDPAHHFFDYQCFKSNRPTPLAELLLDFYLPNRAEVRGFFFPAAGCLHYLLADERFRERVLSGFPITTTNYGPYSMETLLPGRTITHITCDWAQIASRSMDVLAQVVEGRRVPEILREGVRLIEGETVPHISSALSAA